MAAHCNCMAGLGEACSHVASLMFYIDAAVRIRDSKTVTQEKAYWMLPSALDKVDYVPVSDMDFSSPSTKKRKLIHFEGVRIICGLHLVIIGASLELCKFISV